MSEKTIFENRLSRYIYADPPTEEAKRSQDLANRILIEARIEIVTSGIAEGFILKTTGKTANFLKLLFQMISKILG